MKARRIHLVLTVSVAALFLAGASPAIASDAQKAIREVSAEPVLEREMAERWGIEIQSLRLSAASYMLDFRYRVIDAEKARPLFDRSTKPVLIDQASGAQLRVPRTAKVGPLRSSNPPIAGRTYFMFFANPAKFVKPGNRVTVAIGDFRAENLVVE